MKCEPIMCSPEPTLRQIMATVKTSVPTAKRRR